MVKKILEDVKFNTTKKIKKPTKEVFIEETFAGNHNPTHRIEESSNSDVSKYDFFKKRDNLSVSRQRIFQTPQMPHRRPFNKTILFIFILSIIIGVLYLLSTVFLRANISVITKNKTFDLKHQKFTASKMLNGSIPFELMVVSDKESKDIVLTNSKEANDKAKGEIILYNEYSKKAQKITAGSFLSDESGKTYKTDTTVSIPAYTLDKDKKIIPGEVSVSITSFLPGDSYNGNPTSFFINSFKGTDKYKKIYGKAKTAMTGGATGLVYMLDEATKADVSSKTVSLREKLLRKLGAQVPDGYVLYPNSINFSYELDDNIISKTPDVVAVINGTLSVYIIKESELFDSLINKLLPSITDEEKSEIVKPDLTALTFNFTDSNQMVNKDINSFDFELTGSLPLKWEPSILKLKNLLVDKNKNEVNSIFKKDPGVSSASVKIIPFWSKKLPKNLNNINITLK